jgi:hypothetical protein
MSEQGSNQSPVSKHSMLRARKSHEEPVAIASQARLSKRKPFTVKQGQILSIIIIKWGIWDIK